MRGLGTIINVALLIGGGLVGLLAKQGIKDKMRDTLMYISGVAVLFIGIAGAVEEIFTVEAGKLNGGGTVMMVVSLAVGAIIGELLKIEDRIENFGAWLKKVSHSEKDNRFIDAFVNASCTVCIGAMAIMGSIQDGISGDISTLVVKGLLDALIICIMTASQGKGCIFSAVPVAIFQGTFTIIAIFAGNFLPEASISNLSYVGSILIFCVGLNLIREKKISVANCLPAVIIAAIWGLF